MCQFKKTKWLLAYALFVCCCLLFNACATITSCSKRNQEKLAQKVIFAYYFEQFRGFKDIIVGEGLPQIDPLLCSREILTINGKIYFEEPMHSELLKYKHYRQSLKLVIPDSLRNRFRYISRNTDYEHDFAIIHQFSPLLPTREHGIFLMEHNLWGGACNDDVTDDLCVRFLSRTYLKVKIDDGKVIFLDDNKLDLETSGFIGFGSFSRKKLESTPPEKE